MQIITYEIPQMVRVRKYSVDCESLVDCLREHKAKKQLNNKHIAKYLNVPITMVEHWFRRDKCFSIPDAEVWFKLKHLLDIKNTEFDESIMTFEEKENVFEKGNRIYDCIGLCPTITCIGMEITILDRSNRMEVRSLGNICKDNWGTGFPGNVWDKDNLCPTLTTMQGGYRQPMIIDEVKVIGDLFDDNGHGSMAGRVYDSEGQCPTLGASNFQKIKYILEKNNCDCEKTIVAMRGRNPENPSDRTVGSPTEQRLEPNSQGICNTLTSVQKDNLVMEKVCYIDEQNMNARNDVVGTLTTDGSSPKHNNRVLEAVRIKQATKEGYIECKVGGVADLLYPSSTTRRGRVQDNGDVSPTITSMENGLYKIESQYRIRKLTPRECWRLMDFSDADFDKAAEVNSNTQLYKQAGNSIVKNVLIAIFGQMIPGKENAYKEINRKEEQCEHT